MPLFESYERRIDQINAELAKHGISSIEEAKTICDEAGVDANEALEKASGQYGRVDDAAKLLDPREE